MKRVLKLVFCIEVLTVLLAVNAFGAELFIIPSAGAETVLREIPTSFVYNADWQSILETLSKPVTVPDTGEVVMENTDNTEAAETTDAAEEAVELTGEDAGTAEAGADAADTAVAGGTEETTENTEPAASQTEAETATAPVATNNRVVCIDAGHQSKGNNAQEPIGPGAAQTKAKVAGGTRGVATGVPEYQLTLDVAMKLQSELQSRGYTVIMCRTSHDVNISNAERAEIANNAGAGAFLRLHGNGAGSGEASGAETLAPSSSNPYCSGIAAQSQALSKTVLDGLCAATGAKNRGVKITDNMSGINWSRVPVTIVEMGYMTNAAEDAQMQDPSYQAKLAKGMADGVDAFFGL